MTDDVASETRAIPPKKFLNEPNNAVSELIEGLLLQYPNKLQKLENHNVLLSSKISYDRVNILSGGGSGHEPSHAGWIAEKGMLTGAILGGIFASPAVASILAAIRAVTQVNSGPGCLLVVKNYTGDRLNFGMACEKANAEGRLCRMIVVADDNALDETKGITGARGVAGTVLVHKVLGAGAARGMSLDELVGLAKPLQDHIGTMGVALDSVTIPGAASVNDRLDHKTIEIGLGIHGEAGVRQSPLLTADEVAQVMVSAIHGNGRRKNKSVPCPFFLEGEELVVLVNNLGGTSNFEMSILTQSIVKLLESPAYKNRVTRLYVGSYMTSFDMRGASVSILPINEFDPECDVNVIDKIVQLLDDETDAISWVQADVWNLASETRPSANELSEVEAPSGDNFGEDLSTLPIVSIKNLEQKTNSLLTHACQSIIANEPLLTKYDTIVGDGDCGITMKRGATEILARLESGKIDLRHPATIFASLAEAVSASMGGTSGILIELMFQKMSTTLKSDKNDTKISLAKAFVDGVEAVSFYGGANVGSRTMLDALLPASAVLNETLDIAAAANKAVSGAESTATMAASAGRSNYLSESTLQGTPDPGAFAAGLVIKTLADTIATFNE